MKPEGWLPGRYRRGGGRGHGQRVYYEYVVDGKRYESSRVQFGFLLRGTGANYPKYSPYQQVTVYYCPESPEESVLEPPSAAGARAGFVVAAVLVGVGLLAWKLAPLNKDLRRADDR